jgi:hypothetical protein
MVWATFRAIFSQTHLVALPTWEFYRQSQQRCIESIRRPVLLKTKQTSSRLDSYEFRKKRNLDEKEVLSTFYLKIKS